MNIQLQNIVPVSEARVKLNEMVNQTRPNNPYIISKSGKPRVVMVDISEYDQLMKIKAREELGVMTKTARNEYAKYLKNRGIDLNKLSDKQAEKILLNEFLA